MKFHTYVHIRVCKQEHELHRKLYRKQFSSLVQRVSNMQIIFLHERRRRDIETDLVP